MAVTCQEHICLCILPGSDSINLVNKINIDLFSNYIKYFINLGMFENLHEVKKS